jgi:hypothetical protein
MCIAWTSLFHAIFYRRNIQPCYKEKNSKRYVKIEGDYKHWELKTCVEKYFTHENDPIRKNIEFFIPLRNKLEHRSYPEIDTNIFAECQSLLLNLDKILFKEFGEKYCLRESLSFALQLYPSRSNIGLPIKENPDVSNIIGMIEKYRSSLSSEVMQSGDYSFKAFLIQVTNHQSKEALPIQFFLYDELTEDQKKAALRFSVLIKHKHISQPVANEGLLKPGAVVKRVQEAFGNPKRISGKKEVEKFNIDWHTR